MLGVERVDRLATNEKAVAKLKARGSASGGDGIMPGGRPPKPTRIKELTGNPGRRPLNKREPKPQAKAPTMPPWLDAEAKKVWRFLAPRLAKLGLLTVVDQMPFASYCQACSEFKQATEVLQKEGRFTRTGGWKNEATGEWEGGQLQPHPAISMQRSAWATIKQFSSLFGLDPSSRSRLNLSPEEKDENPFEALMRSVYGSN